MERYDVMTPREGRDGKTYWTRIGVMFPNRNGGGFSISFEALPVPQIKDGKIEVRAVAMAPREKSDSAPAQAGSGSGMLDDDVPFAPW